MAIVGFIVLLVAAVATSSQFLEAQDRAQQVAQQLQPASNVANDLAAAVPQLERGVRNYIVTGRPASLAPFRQARTASQDYYDELTNLLGDDYPIVDDFVAATRAIQQQWIDTVALPAIREVRQGDPRQAHALLNSPVSAEQFKALEDAVGVLQTGIDDQRRSKFDQLATFANHLSIALTVSGLLLLAGLIVTAVASQWWILGPLDRLRRQLRRVAQEGDHETPIIPDGPPELLAVGADAEHMRRQLVSEIDEARMAREGLAQEGPVVAAIRAELSRPDTAWAPGLQIFGQMQPAEGVLAGDWWDSIAMPDGRTAVAITDVSGHGPAAGIAGLRLKLTIRSVLEAGGSLSELARRAAALFANDDAHFATLAVVVIDPTQRTLEWLNAGHPAPSVWRGEQRIASLTLTGPLLSELGGTWELGQLPVESDDLLALWTDGLTESSNGDHDQLDDGGLDHYLSQALITGPREPAAWVPTVLSAARDRSVDWRRDDVTLVGVHCAFAEIAPSENRST